MNTYKPSLLLIAAALGASAFCSPLFASSHDQDPTAISTPAPKYPYELRRAKVEGAVLVSYTITAQGNVAKAVAVKSTDLAFEESALKAVREWKFNPAMKDGQAIDLPTLQVVTFAMTGRDSETPVAALVETMRPRHAIEIAASHDKCFCKSGKMFSECHGTAKFLILASN